MKITKSNQFKLCINFNCGKIIKTEIFFIGKNSVERVAFEPYFKQETAKEKQKRRKREREKIREIQKICSEKTDK